jgi:hypothetical protein
VKNKIDTCNIWYGFAINKWISCVLIVSANGLVRIKQHHDTLGAALEYVADNYEGVT